MKRRSRTEPFAGIPKYVLETDAYVQLKPLAKALLVELAGQFNGRNNGFLSLTREDLKARGFSTPKSNQTAISELLASGFVVRTRKGGISRGKGICDLFAVTWAGVDERENTPLDEFATLNGRKELKSWLFEVCKKVPMLIRRR